MWSAGSIENTNLLTFATNLTKRGLRGLGLVDANRVLAQHWGHESRMTDSASEVREGAETSRGAGRSLPGFGIMVDQKIRSVRKAFYFRAGYLVLDVIDSVGFDHELSEKYRSLGCLE